MSMATDIQTTELQLRIQSSRERVDDLRRFL